VEPFKAQKPVVATGIAIGINAAHIWTRFVDCAMTFVLIKEHANGFVNCVLAMPQHLRLALDELGKFLLGFLGGDTEMLTQPGNIEF
jgi:hypothetical protein